jgi:hypothetical protein
LGHFTTPTPSLDSPEYVLGGGASGRYAAGKLIQNYRFFHVPRVLQLPQVFHFKTFALVAIQFLVTYL